MDLGTHEAVLRSLRIDEAQHDVRVEHLHVAVVERLQTDELAGQTRADELLALVEQDRPVRPHQVDVAERIAEIRQDLGVPSR